LAKDRGPVFLTVTRQSLGKESTVQYVTLRFQLLLILSDLVKLKGLSLSGNSEFLGTHRTS